MKNYIDSVLSALRDLDVVVGEQIDKVNDYFFVDVALESGKPTEALLLDFDATTLSIAARFGDSFSTDTPHVNALAYIALSRANDALMEKRKPGKCLLNLDVDKARYMYSASIPLLKSPKEMAAFIKQAIEGIMQVRGFLSSFAQRANDGMLSIDDVLLLEPLEEGQMHVTLHPVLGILAEENINANDGEEEE